MLKSKFLLFVMMVCCATASMAQKVDVESLPEPSFTPSDNSRTIFFHPFNVFASQVKVGFEQRFATRHGLLLEPMVIFDQGEYLQENFGAGMDVNYRYYMVYKNLLNRKKERVNNMMGFYVSPFIGYQFLETDEITYYESGFEMVSTGVVGRQHAVMGGATLGLRFDLIEGRFTLDFNAGFGMKNAFTEYQNEEGQIVDSEEYERYVYEGIHRFGVSSIIPRGSFTLGVNF